MNELTPAQVGILKDLFEEVIDKLRHYDDGETGWDRDDLDVFWEMDRKLMERARELNLWWAR